jgi:hypothetical protein
MVHFFSNGDEAWRELENIKIVRYGGRLVAVRGCLEGRRQSGVFIDIDAGSGPG